MTMERTTVGPSRPNSGPGLKVTVFSSEAMLLSPGKLLREMVADLAASHELAWRLALRDVKSQYRGDRKSVV